jgi:hypothetical protein
MYRFLTPILAIIVSVTLFFTFIKPTFNQLKVVDGQIADYKGALDKAQQLQERIDELDKEKNSINESDLSRLQTFLPDSLDEVSIVLILDDVATRHNLVLDAIKVKSSSGKDASTQAPGTLKDQLFADDPKAATKEIVGADGSTVLRPQDNVEAVALSFGVTGSYTDFRSFLADLEKSLALMDITSIGLKAPAADSDLGSYGLGVTMYRFKPAKK